jgi:hypothetical protein
VFGYSGVEVSDLDILRTRPAISSRDQEGLGTWPYGYNLSHWLGTLTTTTIMNLGLPIRSASSRRNEESRNHFTNYTPTSSTEAIAGPIREPAPLNDRLIVGLDFGTTYSG